ncbi:MAG: NPCBM/NEW2 domain-containing protein [Gemmatales bacterium]|nr:NPCBM/NEW2 domain-containing protein [Gemmatales bacterium]MDW7993123.1 NPCBM/NEW2 domain-containing protein [Gemmatales bacterium]
MRYSLSFANHRRNPQTWLRTLLPLSLLCVVYQLDAQQAQPVTVDLRLRAGETVRGQLVALNEKEVVVQVGKDPVSKPLTEVMSLAFGGEVVKSSVKPETPQAQVRLLDGTTLLAQQITLREKVLECRLFHGQALSVMLDHVHWVLLTAQDAKARAELEQVVAKRPAQDVVLVLSRDQQAINAFSGVILGTDEKGTRLNFRLEEDVVPIDMGRLRGMVFARRAEAKPDDAIRVVDRFGNVWLAKTIVWQKDRLQLETTYGLKTDLGWNQLLTVDFSQGRLVYLSDLEPLRVEEKPLLADVWRYRRDRNLSGGPISVGQRVYQKGLTVHSRTVLEYHVEGYREFRCILGIEDSVNGAAKAVVRIEGDGRELLQTVVRTGEKPREVVLSIENVIRLRLIVDYGDDLDLGDHVAFAEARILK